MHTCIAELFEEQDLDFWSPPSPDETAEVMVARNQESDLMV